MDKKQSGYVIANNYFSTQGSYLSGLDGEGYIETLKAGKANLSQTVADRYTDETYIDDLSSVVSGWLSTNTSFDNVEDLMLSDNTAKIKEFVTFVGNYSDNPAAYFA